MKLKVTADQHSGEQRSSTALEIIAFHLGDQQFGIRTTVIREIRDGQLSLGLHGLSRMRRLGISRPAWRRALAFSAMP